MMISAAWVLAMAAQTSPPKPAPAGPEAAAVSPPARFYEPKTGDTASLAVQPDVPGGPRPFFLLTAPDKASWDQFLNLNRSRAPRPEYEKLADAGRLFSESAATRVQVIAAHPESAVRVGGSAFYPVEVQILEGPRQGHRGYVSHRYLTPSPARPVAARSPRPQGDAGRYAPPVGGSAHPAPAYMSNSLQARQRQYEAETLQRQRNDQAMQETSIKIQQDQQSRLIQYKIMQERQIYGVNYDQNGVIISP